MTPMHHPPFLFSYICQEIYKKSIWKKFILINTKNTLNCFDNSMMARVKGQNATNFTGKITYLLSCDLDLDLCLSSREWRLSRDRLLDLFLFLFLSSLKVHIIKNLNNSQVAAASWQVRIHFKPKWNICIYTPTYYLFYIIK